MPSQFTMPCEPEKPYTSVNLAVSAYWTWTHSPVTSWLISVHAGAAVDDERLAGDEIAVRGREEGDRADEVPGLLQPLQRARRGGGLAIVDDVFVRVLLRQRAARRDAVHAD